MNEKQKQKIIGYLQDINTVQPEDVSQIVQAILKIMNDVKLALENQIANTKNDTSTAFSNLESRVKNLSTSSSSQIKELSNELADEILRIGKELARIESNIPSVKDWTAEVGYLEDLIKTVAIKIPKLPDELSAEKIRDKLETLKGDNRLDESAIKGLEEKLKKLEDKISKGSARIVGGGRSNNSTQFYDLTSQTNGSLKVFSVPKSKAAIVLCSDFPTVLMEKNGFTLNASRTQLTLTVTNAPSSGSQLLFQYTSIFNT